MLFGTTGGEEPPKRLELLLVCVEEVGTTATPMFSPPDDIVLKAASRTWIVCVCFTCEVGEYTAVG